MVTNVISCNSCNELLSLSDLLGHVQEIHHGPPAFEMVKVACSQCPFKVSKEKLNLMLDHCRVTKHEAAEVDLQDWEEFICAEQVRTRAILKEALDLLLAGRNSESTTPGSVGSEAKEHRSVISTQSLHQSTIGKTPKIPVSKTRRSLQQVLPSLTSSTRQESKRPRLSVEDSVQKNEDDAEKSQNEGPTKKKAASSRKARESSALLLEDEQPNSSTSSPANTTSTVSSGEQQGGVEMCSSCSKNVKMRQGYETLVSHVLGHEYKIKAYLCSACPKKRSARRANLQAHARTHSCGGVPVPSFTPEDVPLVREMLQESFSQIDWDQVCAEGIPGFSIEGNPGLSPEDRDESESGNPGESSGPHDEGGEDMEDEMEVLQNHMVKTETPTDNDEIWNSPDLEAPAIESPPEICQESVEGEGGEDSAEEEGMVKQVEENPEIKEKKVELESCQICTEDVKSQPSANLVRHLLQHENIKPYKCQDCEYESICKIYVKTHSKKTGCSSGFKLELSQEQRNQISSRLETAFPQINWEKKLVKGIPGISAKDFH